jgi:hypothetical protein
MEVRDKLHALAALLPGKKPPVSTWIGSWINPRAGNLPYIQEKSRNNKWGQVDERWEAGGQWPRLHTCQVLWQSSNVSRKYGSGSLCPSSKCWYSTLKQSLLLPDFMYSLIITSYLIRKYKTYAVETASLTFPSLDEFRKQMSSFAYKPKFHDSWKFLRKSTDILAWIFMRWRENIF